MNSLHSKSSKCGSYVSSGLPFITSYLHPLTKTCLLGGIKGPLRFYLALGKKKQLITPFLLPSVKVQLAPSEPTASLLFGQAGDSGNVSALW